MTKDFDLTAIADLAASLPPIDAAAHDLAARLLPSVTGSGRHTYKLSEARNALKLASNSLSIATSEFHRVAALLKQQD